MILGYKQTEEHKRKINIAHKGKIVSKETRNKISISHKGEKNGMWINGKSFEPYNQKWNNKFKRLIRKRDNYICLKCGKHQEKEKRTLCIHHINYDKKLSIKENCLSLCRSCHSETNSNRKHWIIFFQSLLNEKYNYYYDENQKIIINIEGIKNE